MSPAQRVICAHGLGTLTTLTAVLARPCVAGQPLGVRLCVGLALVAVSSIGLKYLVGSDGETDRDSSGPKRPSGDSPA